MRPVNGEVDLQKDGAEASTGLIRDIYFIDAAGSQAHSPIVLSWLKRIWPPAPKQVETPIVTVVPQKRPYVRGYTLSEFRANESLVKLSRDLFEDSLLGGHLMAVLINEMPSGNAGINQPIDPTTVSVGLGQVQGYLRAIAVLQSCCVPVQKDNVPEADYGVDLDNLKGDDWENVPLKDARQNE